MAYREYQLVSTGTGNQGTSFMPIDPSLKVFLADPRNTVHPPPAHLPMEKVRAAADSAMSQGDAPELVKVIDGNVPATAGPVPFRHYRPATGIRLPVIFFFHGGGFVWGSIETHDGICRRMAAQTGAAVVSVGYRLAPEAPYPAAVEDGAAVIDHFLEVPEKHGVDVHRFALCGDSAGGNIAISLCARMVSESRAPIHLALVYPAIDPSCDSASQHELADGPLLTRAAMQWFWSCYLGTERPADLASCGDPSGFPTTSVVTAEYDPLRAEGEDFARRLERAGVTVNAACLAGLVHGFLSLPIQAPEVEGQLSRALWRPLHNALWSGHS